jgi:hypothetical protein
MKGLNVLGLAGFVRSVRAGGFRVWANPEKLKI